MRLSEVTRGDTLGFRILIPIISLLAGMRLPDAARAVFYHKKFFGDPMSAWTHATMRGESEWSITERELVAALTAKWNGCPFCIGAHGAVAARAMGKQSVDLENIITADASPQLKVALPFLEQLTRQPDDLTYDDVRAVLNGGVSRIDLIDIMAVCVAFNITARCASILDYEMLDEAGFRKASKRLLEQGYAFGQPKSPAHPNHETMIEALRKTVLEGPGVTAPELRQAIADSAVNDTSMQQPYRDFAALVRTTPYKITDEHIAQLVEKQGSQKAAYELIVAAIVGVGLHQWRRGMELLHSSALPSDF